MDKHQQKNRSASTGVDSISLPTLSNHPPQDLSLAERSMWELVKDSHFFPPDAAKEDWEMDDTLNNSKLNFIFDNELD